MTHTYESEDVIREKIGRGDNVQTGSNVEPVGAVPNCLINISSTKERRLTQFGTADSIWFDTIINPTGPVA